MAILNDRDIKVKLAEALGIDPWNVTSIQIDATVKSAIQVTVTRFVTRDELDRVVTILGAVQWKEQPNADSTDHHVS